MKKISFIVCLLAILFITAPMAIAATSAQTSEEVTITGTNDNPNFIYSASPNVGVQIFTAPNGYTIATANIQTEPPEGMEYCTFHTSTGYAARVKNTDAGTSLTANGPVAPTALETLPAAGSAEGGGAWRWFGGS